MALHYGHADCVKVLLDVKTNHQQDASSNPYQVLMYINVTFPYLKHVCSMCLTVMYNVSLGFNECLMQPMFVASRT